MKYAIEARLGSIKKILQTHDAKARGGIVMGDSPQGPWIGLHLYIIEGERYAGVFNGNPHFFPGPCLTYYAAINKKRKIFPNWHRLWKFRKLILTDIPIIKANHRLEPRPALDSGWYIGQDGLWYYNRV